MMMMMMMGHIDSRGRRDRVGESEKCANASDCE